MNNNVLKLKIEEKQLFEYVRKHSTNLTIPLFNFISDLKIVLTGQTFKLFYCDHVLFIVTESYNIDKSDDNINIIDTDDYSPFIDLLTKYKIEREEKIVYNNIIKKEELKRYLELLNK